MTAISLRRAPDKKPAAGHWVTIHGAGGSHPVFIPGSAGHVPARVKHAHGSRFTKAEIERAMHEHYHATGGGWGPEHDKELADTNAGGDPWTFKGKLPTEVKEHMAGRPELRKLFRVTADKGGGADAFGALGDRYFDLAELAAGSPTRLAKEHAAKSGDPELEFLAHVHANLATGKDRAEKVKLDPAGLRVGDAFEVNGETYRVAEDADGYRVLKQGKDYSVPVDALRAVPADKGTFRGGRAGATRAGLPRKPDDGIPFSRAFDPARGVWLSRGLFDEHLHPREPDGTFAEKGAGGMQRHLYDPVNRAWVKVPAEHVPAARPLAYGVDPAKRARRDRERERQAAEARKPVPEKPAAPASAIKPDIFGNPSIESSGVGRQAGMFGEPEPKPAAPKPVGSVSANDPRHTAPLPFAAAPAGLRPGESPRDAARRITADLLKARKGVTYREAWTEANRRVAAAMYGGATPVPASGPGREPGIKPARTINARAGSRHADAHNAAAAEKTKRAAAVVAPYYAAKSLAEQRPHVGKLHEASRLRDEARLHLQAALHGPVAPRPVAKGDVEKALLAVGFPAGALPTSNRQASTPGGWDVHPAGHDGTFVVHHRSRWADQPDADPTDRYELALQAAGLPVRRNGRSLTVGQHDRAAGGAAGLSRRFVAGRWQAVAPDPLAGPVSLSARKPGNPVAVPAALEGRETTDEKTGAPVSWWWKDAIETGHYEHPWLKKGQVMPGITLGRHDPYEFDVTPARLDHWVRTFKEMRRRGIRIPVVLDHSDKSKDAIGTVEDMVRDGNRIRALHRIVGADAELAVQRNCSSIQFANFKDARSGRVFADAIVHNAVTPIPVAPGLGPFLRTDPPAELVLTKAA